MLHYISMGHICCGQRISKREAKTMNRRRLFKYFQKRIQLDFQQCYNIIMFFEDLILAELRDKANGWFFE